MRVSIIVAIAENNAIGKDNKLIYWLPDDLKRFKSLTTGNTIIMGRKTFESLPKGALPNRRNIVLTRNENLDFEGAERFGSLKDALDACCNDEEVFVIGGERVYRQAMEMADRLCITLIHDTPADADAFFPEINSDEWEEVMVEPHYADEKHKYDFDFINYERK